jgi:TPR repeat protein
MKVKLWLGALAFLLCSRAIAADSSLTNRFSPKSFGARGNPLRLDWTSIVTATNQWAAALRQQPGWSNVVDASFEQTRSMAESGVLVAQLKLGFCYFTGEDVEPNYPEGAKWLSDAQRFPLAQFLLGAASLHGLGMPEDFVAGVDWLDKAASEGVADAQFQLGLCYLTGGPGVNQAPARGAKWLERAAEQGHARAQQCLGECYAVGAGVEPDEAKAVQWYLLAAGQGLPTAQDFLGVCYAAGSGVTRDPAQAAKWFGAAATQQLALAQANLARCYEVGDGVAKDSEAALRWWRQAADLGFPGARFHLGLDYYLGQGSPRNTTQAVECFQQDARRGHVGAQLFLGLCYWKGEGVDKDSAGARKCWREAALQGIRPAQYLAGDGAPGDAAEIEGWWREVARQGDPGLQCCVAEFYQYGRGVKQNESEALRWYRQAAAGGDLVSLKAAAWLLSTSDDARLRDGVAAVELAEKAAGTTKHKDPMILDTLAAAYAEANQFDKAVATQKEAIAASKRDSEREELEVRLKLYQDKKPYRAGLDQKPASEL